MKTLCFIRAHSPFCYCLLYSFFRFIFFGTAQFLVYLLLVLSLETIFLLEFILSGNIGSLSSAVKNSY